MEEINQASKTKRPSFLIVLSVLLGFICIVQAVYLFSLTKPKKEVTRPPLSYRNYHANSASHPTAPLYPRAFEDSWNDPFYELERMQEQMNRMFSRSLRHVMSLPNSSIQNDSLPGLGLYEPDLDIQDEKDHYVIRMDLPGMEKDKIDIRVEENALSVSGERKIEREDKAEPGYYRMERSYGGFSRQIPLPEDVNPDGVRAEYQNGVLTIRLAKEVKATGSSESEGKKIAVQ